MRNKHKSRGFIDILEQEKRRDFSRRTRVKTQAKETSRNTSKEYEKRRKLKVYALPPLRVAGRRKKKRAHRWMPRLWKAKKDVVSCDKPR